ncbi:MAG: TrbI/VirB10 family protein [Alphaproteobacteria bacterium]
MTWDHLSARTRRWLTVGGVSAGVFLGCWMIASGFSTGTGKTKRAEINESILTDADTRQTTIDRLAAQLESSRSENADLARKLEELAERQQRLPETVAQQLQRSLDRDDAAQGRVLEGRLQQLEVQLERIDERVKAAKDEPKKDEADPLKTAEQPDDAPSEAEGSKGERADPVIAAASPGIAFPDANGLPRQQEPASIFERTTPAAPSAVRPGGAPASEGDGANRAGQALAIRFVSRRDADAATEGHADLPPNGDSLFRLPATSILTGTLITGLDAPTGAQAQGEPLPVLLRLKKEAILPNRFKADVRECFALLGAYGDLSSERAHMRGETMSCVLNDGTILEQPLKAFAVGEDGKEGPRGRLVRREGTFIARALLVGFLEAAANAFDDNQVALIGGGASYDIEGAQAAATSLGGAAAGNALGRVADWYIDQAFQLFPVIEIDAGREIDVVLTSTFEMNLPSEDG